MLDLRILSCSPKAAHVSYFLSFMLLTGMHHEVQICNLLSVLVIRHDFLSLDESCGQLFTVVMHKFFSFPPSSEQINEKTQLGWKLKFTHHPRLLCLTVSHFHISTSYSALDHQNVSCRVNSLHLLFMGQIQRLLKNNEKHLLDFKRADQCQHLYN